MAQLVVDTVRERYPDWEHFIYEYGFWRATHKNYDASWEGEEDGYQDNGLKAEGRTLEDLCDDIDNVVLEHDL
jgi:hypothetical protein